VDGNAGREIVDAAKGCRIETACSESSRSCGFQDRADAKGARRRDTAVGGEGRRALQAGTAGNARYEASVDHILNSVHESIDSRDIAGSRADGAVGGVGDVLDDDRIVAAAAKVTRVAGELVARHFGVQIAEAKV